MNSQRESGSIAYSFFNLGDRLEWMVVTPRPFYIWEEQPAPIVQVARWAPGPGWNGTKNLIPTGIRSPDQKFCDSSFKYATLDPFQGDVLATTSH